MKSAIIFSKKKKVKNETENENMEHGKKGKCTKHEET